MLAAQDEYRSSARQMMEWIKRSTAMMDDRSMPNNTEQVRVGYHQGYYQTVGRAFKI